MLKWTIELIPEQTRNNFNHWVGFQVHKGTQFHPHALISAGVYVHQKELRDEFNRPVTRHGRDVSASVLTGHAFARLLPLFSILS